MRKSFISALMICLLLTGCARGRGGLEKELSAFRGELRQAETVQTQTALMWLEGESVSEYGLLVSQSGGEYRVTVTEPALIAGITAVLREGEGRLEYDGLMLGVGEPEGFSPVSALPEMLGAMAYGYAELLWREDDCLAARLWMEEERAMNLWLREGVPVCAEVQDGGETILTCRFDDWQIE